MSSDIKYWARPETKKLSQTAWKKEIIIYIYVTVQSLESDCSDCNFSNMEYKHGKHIWNPQLAGRLRHVRPTTAAASENQKCEEWELKVREREKVV